MKDIEYAEKDLAKFMGDRLRNLRESRRLTQKEVGFVIGVSNTALSNREIGGTAITVREIQIFSKYFGVISDN